MSMLGTAALQGRRIAQLVAGLRRRGRLLAWSTGEIPADLEASRAAAAAWMERAIRAGHDESILARYHVLEGWGHPYPEVTGYVITTLLALADVERRPELVALATSCGDWLGRVRLPNGATIRRQWTGGGEAPPSVFNTGQVLDGWCALHAATGDDRWLVLGRDAGDWLAVEQEVDGSWVRSAHNRLRHSYYARVAWPLARLGLTTGDERYLRAARRHADWVLEQQEDDAWFRHAGFTQAAEATTHTIGYVLEGMLGVGTLLGDDRYVDASRLAAKALRRSFEERGTLSGVFGPHWRALARWRCLTGDAQIGLVWARLHALDGDARWRAAALEIADQLRRTQRLRPDWPETSGAVAGSKPFWGDYDPLAYPAHAAKFLVDLHLALAPPAGGPTRARG